MWKNCWKIQKFVKVWKNFLTIIAIFYEKLAKTIKKPWNVEEFMEIIWFLKILPRIIEKISENFDNFFKKKWKLIPKIKKKTSNLWKLESIPAKLKWKSQIKIKTFAFVQISQKWTQF